MSDDGMQSADAAERWAAAKPEKIPLPTYAPLFLALGIILLLFGIVSMYVFCCIGLILIIWSISKWVGELFHGW